MRASRRGKPWPIGAGLMLAMLSAGCGGYWPLRWPSRDLWAAIPDKIPAVQAPTDPVKDYSHQLTQDGVSVGIDWLSPAQARDIFHVDLARNGVQPLLVAIQNMSGQPYELRKSEMGLPAASDKAQAGLRVIPASRVAALACPGPVRALARYVKWLAFLVPGFVFETVVEPTSTMDFPIMREASRRPAASGCRYIREDFIRQELADGEIAPGQSRSGVVFMPPVGLGGTVSIILAPAGTRAKAAWVFPTPAPVYARTERYAHAPTVVWDAVLKVVRHVASWRIRRADRATGTIDVRKGWKWLPGSAYAPIIVAVREDGAGLTRVSIASPLPRPTSVHYGEHSRTIDRFFEELTRRLPGPPPSKPAKQPLAPAASGPEHKP